MRRGPAGHPPACRPACPQCCAAPPATSLAFTPARSATPTCPYLPLPAASLPAGLRFPTCPQPCLHACPQRCPYLPPACPQRCAAPAPPNRCPIPPVSQSVGRNRRFRGRNALRASLESHRQSAARPDRPAPGPPAVRPDRPAPGPPSTRLISSLPTQHPAHPAPGRPLVVQPRRSSPPPGSPHVGATHTIGSGERPPLGHVPSQQTGGPDGSARSVPATSSTARHPSRGGRRSRRGHQLRPA